MSSSKIIKLAADDGSSISEFAFRALGHSGVVPSPEKASGGFVPLGLFQGFDQAVAAEIDEIDAGPPPIEISEDDLKQRINDAFNDGLKEGKELAERGLINVFHALRSSSETIHSLRDKIIRESEDEILKLIMLVARKVIIREVSEDRSILAEVVQNALAGLSAREEITVRINPDDYQLLSSGRDELLRKDLFSDNLLLKPDPSVASGFCLVDTEMGTVDASLDGQLEQLYRSLLEQRTVAAVEAQ
jgi:flagellar assembly protein FliH